MPRRLLLSALLYSVIVAPGAMLSQRVGSGTIEGAEALNVRSGPGVEHTATGTLRRGDAVEVEAIEGKWARVKHAGGQGWVFAQFVTIPTAGPEPATPTPVQPVGEEDPSLGATTAADGAPPTAGPAVVEARLGEDVRGEIDRILTLTEAMHHDLERRRNSPPVPSQDGSGVGLQSGIGLLALGGVIGFFVGTILARQQERHGRSRVRF